MKFAKLILRNVIRGKIRTLLTVLGVGVSIFIFAALLSLDQGVKRMIASTGGERVVTVFSRYAACAPYSKLPVHYADKISALKHVQAVMPVRFLLSNCRTTTDLIAIHGVEPLLFRQFRRIELPEEQYTAFEAERGSALVGAAVARKYGWRIGQQVSLPQLRGISFSVRGIFISPGSSLENVVLVSREYLERTVNEPGVATMLLVLADDAANVSGLSKSIDALFSNYETQTRSTAERDFISGLISDMAQMVQFAQYVAYFALLLLLAAVANTVSMSMRDRLREMAVLKLLGFDSDGVVRLVLFETVATALLGAVLGLGLALLTLAIAHPSISSEGYTITPVMTRQVLGLGFGAGALLGYCGALLPARAAARMPIVQALKEVD
jgi:putative ABC transport system permease protein